MATTTGRSVRNPAMTLIAVLVAVWLVIGVIAGIQRDYFSSTFANCAKVGSTVVTILAGPLNYFGANPKISCKVPQPSK
jgi:DNA-binding transcriptional regulator of glucitol operon